MIEVQSVDLTKLHSFVGEFAKAAKISASDAIAYQGGLLIKDLVKSAPPKDRKETANRITKALEKRFEKLADSGKEFNAGDSSKTGTGDVRWYNFTSKAIYGVAKDLDYSSANEEDVWHLLNSTNMKGRLTLGFLDGRKTSQKVVIAKKIAVRKTMIQKIIRRAIATIGKLKASWAIGWRDPRLKISGTPEQWIAKHIDDGKARGSMLLDLSSDRPSITLISNASGCEKSVNTVKNAVAVRIESIKRDLKLYWSGVKNADDFRKKMNFTSV